jgi:hypothetical protein
VATVKKAAKKSAKTMQDPVRPATLDEVFGGPRGRQQSFWGKGFGLAAAKAMHQQLRQYKKELQQLRQKGVDSKGRPFAPAVDQEIKTWINNLDAAADALKALTDNPPGTGSSVKQRGQQ